MQVTDGRNGRGLGAMGVKLVLSHHVSSARVYFVSALHPPRLAQRPRECSVHYCPEMSKCKTSCHTRLENCLYTDVASITLIRSVYSRRYLGTLYGDEYTSSAPS